MTNRKWSELTQSICTAALILLLGIASYVLVRAAGSAYGSLTEQQQTDYNLRVAAHYVTNKVRQHDTAGGVAVEVSPFGDCIVLCETIDGDDYETRIYLTGGMLRESFVSAGAPYDDETAFDVVELDGFAVQNDSLLRVELAAGGETRTVSVAPRVGGVR